MRYNYGVIGLGRVGASMLALLQDAGHHPLWAVSSRGHDLGIPVYKTLPERPEGAQVVLISVPDGRIRHVAEQIKAAWGRSCKQVAFLHFSGLLTSLELDSLRETGADAGSLHPLQAITDVSQARRSMKGGIFTFEGDVGAFVIAQEIVDSIGATLMKISPQDKVLYHAAAVVASNYLVALMDQASEIISSVGMGLGHLMPLVKGTLSNIEQQGGKALTGPIARGDWATVQAHVQALEKQLPDLLGTYLALGAYTARMAGQRFPEGLLRSPKLTLIDELLEILKAKRSRSMKVVFTNGCFDIIHAGHVTYLSKARALGDCLVVGLNSDASVRRIKGPQRPVNNEKARAAVLGALESVDHVVVFEEDTPLNLIERIRPHVLVKGGDWAPEEIVGADVVRSSGGQVLTIPFEEGFSTTLIIDKIR